MPRYIDVEEFKHNINASDLYGTEAWDKIMNILADTKSVDAESIVHAYLVNQRHIELVGKNKGE